MLSEVSPTERDKTMNTYVYENKTIHRRSNSVLFLPLLMSDEQQKKMMESFFAAMNSGEFKP